MYDKRVGPDVASKFDYFISSLFTTLPKAKRKNWARAI